MNANYSFVSCSHFLNQKDAPISKLINCLKQLPFQFVCFTSFSYYKHYFARWQTSLVLFESWYSIGARVYETCLALAFFIRLSLKSGQYCALALNYHLFLHQHGNKSLFRKRAPKRAKYVF